MATRRTRKNSGHGSSSIERRLDRLLYGQYLIMRALNIVHRTQREDQSEDMARFDNLRAQVARMSTRIEAHKKVFQTIQQQLTQAASDMNDEDDQRQVEEIAAEIGTLADSIPQAIEQGTVGAETPAPGSVGGSTGGVTETPGGAGGSTGGVT